MNRTAPARPCIVATTAVAALLTARAAHAAELHLEPADGELALLRFDDSAPAAPRAQVAIDRVELEPYVVAASDYHGTTIVVAGVACNWFVADYLSVGLFGEGMHINQEDDNAGGGGGGVMLRWHFLDNGQWSVFADVGVGFDVFTAPVPAEGTSFDFTPRASVGANFSLDARTALSASVGWLHLSNAQTGENNPGIDTIAIGLGLHFAF